MYRFLLALAMTVLAAGPAFAADARTEVMVTVNQFLDGFNKGDTKAAIAACTDEMSILDEFAPFEWHGAGALANWFSAYEADAKKNGITDGFVTLGKPRHIDVDGDRAYVVVPANYMYKRNGKPVKEIGSTLTGALVKGDAGWHISGWAWGKR